ncbi:MAG: RNA polymerase sigma-70 factor [Pseudobacter sp.]|uniref:RNA polymerase sigma-70 factor n=1 Tax=Pseudobacter sp. TaxID=2045420 RepID=UPI003F7CF8B4
MESNYSSYQENELLAGLRSGSEPAFAEVYKRLYKRVYLFASRFLEQPADAQDLTAETFVQLWNRRTEFYTLDGVAAFLHVTVRNKCFNLLKHLHMKEGKKEELLQLLNEQDDEDFYIEKVQSELLGRIYAEVDKLPPRMREVFLLSYREGLKPAEIAERLQIKVQTVTNQRVSAIRLLQQALGQDPMAMILLAVISRGAGFLS